MNVVVSGNATAALSSSCATLRTVSARSGALGPTGRGEWVARLRDWLFDNDERVVELLQRETGKPWQEAAVEVPLAIDLLEYYRRHAERFLADSHPRPHGLLTASKKLELAGRALVLWVQTGASLVRESGQLAGELGARGACVVAQLAGVVAATANIQARFSVSVEVSASVSASAGATAQ